MRDLGLAKCVCVCLTVGKRAKRMPDTAVETTVLSGGSLNQINQHI